ncbi:hypothetical protein WICPIJ_002936 [Wickerhamomyces pijperi]|uniref:Protein-serine/threonine kinase n=1 Tax=Wickerhamomyces pijperi TaxID=599730 RepID=A0A9P8QAW7_WICPI|nr:hypothetical protein WICPIJ_002936 [Wickerhamomyces pijperi]
MLRTRTLSTRNILRPTTRLQSCREIRTLASTYVPELLPHEQEPFDVTTTPDYTKYHPKISSISKHLSDLSPYPQHSPYINPQHYYQNIVLDDWSARKPHPVSLRQLAAFGKALNEDKIITSANFVRLELPIRLAIKLKELQSLPFDVVNNFHLAKVYESYYDIFDRFRKLSPIKSIEDNTRFCHDLEDVLTDINLLNLPNLLMGALECCILDSLPSKKLDELVSSLLRARISRRLILEEHLSLTHNFMKDPNQSRSHNFIGDIFFKCSAVEHLNISSDNATKFINKIYPGVKVPKLIIKGDKDLKFQFLTSHLHYLFGEILRNCYEATVKTFLASGPGPNDEPFPVEVQVINNQDHISFRFSDRGGGVTDIKPISKVWSFSKDAELAKLSLSNFHQLPNFQTLTNSIKSTKTMKTLARKSLMQTSVGVLDENFVKEATLIDLIQRPGEYKLGLGLAMCKVYADYWNGDLVLHSLSGYGTDTYLKLGKLGAANHDDKLQLDRV